MKVTKQQINDFLNVKSIAIAGVSRTGKKMGNAIFKELKNQKYTVYPINPNCDKIDDVKCYNSVDNLPTKPDAYLTVLPKDKTDNAVMEAVEAKVPKIWANQSEVKKSTEILCNDNNIDLIQNECILMFANPKGGHKFHQFIWKILGKLPN